MEVESLTSFNRDLGKIRNAKTKQSITQIIREVEQADSPSDINNLKKPKGQKFAYRLRIGDYRLGIFIEKRVVQFARLVHRKEIYRIFP